MCTSRPWWTPRVLQGADQLQARPVADVAEPPPGVRPERALHDLPFRRAVEQRAPALQLVDPVGRLLGEHLGHAPVVDQLAAAHRVAEVHLPVVGGIDVAERGGDAALGHHGVRLAQERLGDQRHAGARGRRRDRRPQAGPARADDQHVVVEFSKRSSISGLPSSPRRRRRRTARRRRRISTENRLSQAYSAMTLVQHGSIGSRAHGERCRPPRRRSSRRCRRAGGAANGRTASTGRARSR